MEKLQSFLSVLVLFVCSAGWTAVCEPVPGAIVVSDHVKADGSADVAAAIQALIDANPNRTLWFPDGTYLLGQPIATPADPRRSVDLRLSNFAVLKATPGWTNVEAMVRLGGKCPANDIRTVGSCYSFQGGVIDGAGRAAGLSIDSGRETKVRDVSMKNVTMGIHIKHGANSNSSDADLADVNIVGASPSSSVGVWIESCDNTLTRMRIANVLIGVRLTGSGNLMRCLHPLYTGRAPNYASSVGFEDQGFDNCFDTCYSDHFSTGFLLGKGNGTVLDACIAWWYAPGKGTSHTALRTLGRFRAHVSNLRVGFRGKEAANAILVEGAPGGDGVIRDLRCDESMVTAPSAHKNYMR